MLLASNVIRELVQCTCYGNLLGDLRNGVMRIFSDSGRMLDILALYADCCCLFLMMCKEV